MPAHSHLTDEIAESAALYSLGLLSDSERSSLDRHLAEGCAVCQSEIRRCADLLVLWAQETAVYPPSSLREKLLQSIREPTPQAKAFSPVLLDEAGVRLLRTTKMKWEPGPTSGLSVKVLVHDAENAMTTMLVRMRPGSLYPSHRHKGVEELYVLEGELRVEGVELVEGDFCVSQPESIHQSSYSESGCLLVVRTSKRDECLGKPRQRSLLAGIE
jgi:quercetin dioxygenase-like cupin family protein